MGLSDRPEYQFAGPERVLLRVTLTVGEDAIGDFEIIAEGNSYREWCIPAEIVNRVGTVEILLADQEHEPGLAERWRGVVKRAQPRPGRVEVTLAHPPKKPPRE